MTTFSLTRHSTAAPAVLYAVATDVEGLPKRIPEIIRAEQLTPPPFGVGTRISETRKMFGREASEVFEVTACEPGRSFTMKATSCGAEFVAEHRFTPDATGTQIELIMSIRGVSFFARLLAPLSKLMMGPMKKSLQKDLDRLAEVAEQPATVA